MKECSHCHKKKALKEFGKRKAAPNGIHYPAIDAVKRSFMSCA